jgi:ArsR family transcriptional regulator
VSLDKVFEALSSTVRRKILAYLSATDLTAGEIAARFEISKPSVSKHLSILENAGLVRGDERWTAVYPPVIKDSNGSTRDRRYAPRGNFGGGVPNTIWRQTFPPALTRSNAFDRPCRANT